jgi:hypothetical protein
MVAMDRGGTLRMSATADCGEVAQMYNGLQKYAPTACCHCNALIDTR